MKKLCVIFLIVTIFYFLFSRTLRPRQAPYSTLKNRKDNNWLDWCVLQFLFYRSSFSLAWSNFKMKKILIRFPEWLQMLSKLHNFTIHDQLTLFHVLTKQFRSFHVSMMRFNCRQSFQRFQGLWIWMTPSEIIN